MNDQHLWTGVLIGVSYSILAAWVISSVCWRLVCAFAQAIVRGYRHLTIV